MKLLLCICKNREKINKSYDLKSIDPKDLFKPQNNNNQSVMVNKHRYNFL